MTIETGNSEDGGARVRTAAIRTALKAGTDPAAALRDSFAGWTALVVSAGPSAREWRAVRDRLADGNVAILCVKQAIEIDDLADRCAIHVCNAWNLRRYRYRQPGLLRLYVDDDAAGPSYQRWDVRFRIRRREKRLANAVAMTGDWDGWTLDRTGLDRPWGPGLMYEGVFHLLVHCGFTAIETIGWDIADPSGDNRHFYDRAAKEEGAPAVTGLSTTGARGWARIRRRLRNLAWFATGQVYNKAGMMDGEAELVANSVPVLRRWLEGRGIRLTVHSKSRWLAGQ